MLSEPTASVVDQTENWRPECPLAAILTHFTGLHTLKVWIELPEETTPFKDDTTGAGVQDESCSSMVSRGHHSTKTPL